MSDSRTTVAMDGCKVRMDLMYVFHSSRLRALCIFPRPTEKCLDVPSFFPLHRSVTLISLAARRGRRDDGVIFMDTVVPVFPSVNADRGHMSDLPTSFWLTIPRLHRAPEVI